MGVLSLWWGRRRRGCGQHELVLLYGRGLHVDVQKSGAGHGVRRRRRRGWRGSRALIVYAVRESLHHWLGSWRVRGRDRRFEPRKRSCGRGTGAGEVGCRGWWCRWRGRGRRSALCAKLRERSRSRWSLLWWLALSLIRKQRPLAAVGRTLRLNLGRVKVGGCRVVDRRGGQRRGVQLRGGKGRSLGSDRLAVGICRPRLNVTLVILGGPTLRLRQRTWGARLRQRDTVTRLSKRAGLKRLVTQLTVWVGVF